MPLQIRFIWNTFSLNSSSQDCTIFVTLHMDKKYLSATTGTVSRCVTFTQQFVHGSAFHLIYSESYSLPFSLCRSTPEREIFKEQQLSGSAQWRERACQFNRSFKITTLYVQLNSFSSVSGLESCCVVCFCSLSAWRDSFLRIETLVLIGGPDDGVITPWESRSLHQCYHYFQWAFIFIFLVFMLILV